MYVSAPKVRGLFKEICFGHSLWVGLALILSYVAKLMTLMSAIHNGMMPFVSGNTGLRLGHDNSTFADCFSL